MERIMAKDKEKKKNSLIAEFKEFISRGSVMDLAIGMIMGSAFTAIVNSLVDDIIMPIIGAILSGIDFTTLMISVGDANITYGNFIQAIINFLCISIVVFIIVKAMNKFRRAKEEAPPEPSKEEQLLTEIRDLLKSEQ